MPWGGVGSFDDDAAKLTLAQLLLGTTDLNCQTFLCFIPLPPFLDNMLWVSALPGIRYDYSGRGYTELGNGAFAARFTALVLEL